MDLLTALVLLNVALLQFEGVRSQQIHNHTTGENITLSCETFKDHGPKCSDVDWYYWTVTHFPLIKNGRIENIPRSSRLTLNPDCSLTLHNLTEEDSGTYQCGVTTTENTFAWDNQQIYLRVLSGVRSEEIYLYKRPGEDTTLSCHKHHGPECSNVAWNHYKDSNHEFVVKNGQIENIPRSSRLTLNPDCSLTVHNLTEEDFGRYKCGVRTTENPFAWDKQDVYLSVLSALSSFNQDGLTTLQCSLWSDFRCPRNSLRWLDVNGTVLSGDGVTQIKCVSNLTVERESQHQRTFTCQFVEDDVVKVSAEFRPGGNSDSSGPAQSSWLVSVASAAGASVLVLLAVAAVVVFKIKSKRNSSPTIQDTEDDQQMTDHVADPENNVTYATIDLQKPRAQRQGKVNQEDFVTYSAVNVKTGSDSNHSAIYSNVHKPATD